MTPTTPTTQPDPSTSTPGTADPSAPVIEDASVSGVEADIDAAASLDKPKRTRRAKAKPAKPTTPTRAGIPKAGALFYTLVNPDGTPAGTFELTARKYRDARTEVARYAEVDESHAGTTCRVFKAMGEFAVAVDTVRKVRLVSVPPVVRKKETGK